MATKTPEEIMREAQALIEQTMRSLSATEDILRQTAGAAASADSAQLAQARAEAEALFRKDMEDVEREMAEEAARLSFANATPRAGGPRRMRNMI